MTKIIKIKTPLVAQIRTLFEVLKEILNEASIEFINDKHNTSTDEEVFRGIKILAMSPEQTVLVRLRLYADKFSEFVCTPKQYSIGVNFAMFSKLLKSNDKEDILEMFIDNDNKQVLNVGVLKQDINKKSSFTLKLMDTDNNTIKTKPINPDIKITMASSDFNSLCKNMQLVGSHLEIICTCNTLIFKSGGSAATKQIDYTVSDDGIKILYLHKDKSLIAQGIYDLKNLALFQKCSSLSTDVEIYMNFGKEPQLLYIQYAVATLGEFRACISPIEIDHDDENDDGEMLCKSEEEEIE